METLLEIIARREKQLRGKLTIARSAASTGDCTEQQILPDARFNGVYQTEKN